MKARRHSHWHLLGRDRTTRVRERIGDDSASVYVIDDGREHVLIGHPVGSSPSGCQYCLVGRITTADFDALRYGDLDPRRAFDNSDDVTLCGVVAIDEILTGDVFDVARYDAAADVPREYLPGNPAIDFPSDIDPEF
jgi:hypothetical protein